MKIDVTHNLAQAMYLGISQALDMIQSALDSEKDDETSINLVEAAVKTLMAYQTFYQLHHIPTSDPH